MNSIILAFCVCAWRAVSVLGQTTCVDPAVPNGQPVGKLKQVYSPGETHRFVCDGSYGFVGTHYALCDDGSWIVPACKPLDRPCAAPRVLNGKPEGELAASYPAGSALRFQCDQGYEMEGTHYAVCDGGTWRLPVCKGRGASSCSTAIVPNAQTLDRFLFRPIPGNGIKFECSPDYEFDETSNAECVDGIWTLPVCKLSQCDELQPRIANGDVTVLRSGNKLKVQCVRFYKLVGPETVRCVNGKWTELPECKPPCKLEETGDYLEEGEKKRVPCKSSPFFKQQLECVNGELRRSECKLIWGAE